jgi:hypothetical protein
VLRYDSLELLLYQYDPYLVFNPMFNVSTCKGETNCCSGAPIWSIRGQVRGEPCKKLSHHHNICIHMFCEICIMYLVSLVDD